MNRLNKFITNALLLLLPAANISNIDICPRYHPFMVLLYHFEKIHIFLCHFICCAEAVVLLLHLVVSDDGQRSLGLNL